VAATYGSEKGGGDGAAKSSMMVEGKVMACLVSPEYPIGLMGWWGRDGNRPEAIVHATACDDYLLVLDDSNVVLSEESDAIIVTELGEGD
jgi:hypothetical protein